MAAPWHDHDGFTATISAPNPFIRGRGPAGSISGELREKLRIFRERKEMVIGPVLRHCSLLGRGERLWDGLEALEEHFQIGAVNKRHPMSPSAGSDQNSPGHDCPGKRRSAALAKASLMPIDRPRRQ
jgi:hypothetical protein